MTSKQALSKYGDPFLLQTQQKTMTTWQVPSKLLEAFAHVRFSAVGTIGFPKKIFCNNDFKPLLEKALNNVVDRGLAKEMKTWDGCYVVRSKRGLSSLSMHSWGLAVDINAFENQLNQKPNISPQFVKCFTDAGLEWGGNWKRLDAMHYEMK
jgi:hypothetical protein